MSKLYIMHIIILIDMKAREAPRAA
jgi:hypothetical protein